MIKYILLMMFSILSSNVIFAQKSIVIGVIKDAKTNEPLENVNVQLKNTTTIAITDANGNFKINTAIHSVLIISHINYKEQHYKIKTNNINIYLEPIAVNLDDIVVKANVLKDISQSNVIIDIAKTTTKPRNVGDLFRDIKGFGIQKRGAYASEPVFRAFKYEQLNVQYDGGMKVMNACPNRMDPITTHVTPEEIEKIEIVKGPFTVRFGQNFGGIINLVSKNHTTYKQGFSGSVDAGYEDNGGNFSTSSSIKYRNNKFDVKVTGGYRDYGNYIDGNGVETPTSFRTSDYSIKAGYEATEKQRFQLSWRQSFGRDIKHAGLPMDSPYDNSYLIGADYKVTDISDKVNSIAIKSFYSYVDHLMSNDNRPNFRISEASTNVFATTYGGKVEVSLSPSEEIFLFTGIDANFISRDGSRIRKVKIMNGNPLPTPRTFEDKVWQDSKVNGVGVFAESNFRVSDTYTLTAGIRTDFISSSINDPEQDFFDLYGGAFKDFNETNVSGTLSIKYKTESFQAQLALGRGTRTASMAERYINHFSVGVDPYEYVGNPNLDPETNNQVEISFKKEFKKIEFGTSLFYSLIQDHIVPVVDENLPRKFMPNVAPRFAKRFINVNEATQVGFEFYWNYRIAKYLKFTSDVSYTYAQNKELDEPLPQIMPLTARTTLNFEKNNYWMYLNTRFVAAQRRVSRSFLEEETGGFATIDFSIGIKPIKNVTLGASVLNIFDKAYTEHLNFAYTNSDLLSGRIFEPGRNFTVRASYSF